MGKDKTQNRNPEYGTGMRNRNTEPEYGTGMRNRNTEPEYGTGMRNRNAEPEYGTGIRNRNTEPECGIEDKTLELGRKCRIRTFLKRRVGKAMVMENSLSFHLIEHLQVKLRLL